jgi:orotidine-5'-phosphate decarboxylase
MKEKIILALDVETKDQAAAWVEKTKDQVGLYKVGKQLFTAEGPDVVRMIKKGGGRVFLDLKFHDIPNTVAAASVEALRLGADIFNVHALGGYNMMARSAEAVQNEAERLSIEKPMLIAVTILTSMNEEALRGAGIATPLAEEVGRLAMLAKKAGLDGVVASPQEIGLIRECCGEDFKIITPGVRPAFASKDDQMRTMTPADAVKAGADYLVIGRPITKAENPAKAARMIAEEMCQE